MEPSDINEKIKNASSGGDTYELHEEDAHPDPYYQFIAWFEEVLQSGADDPSAMVLATVDAQGQPDTRVVLLKEVEYQQFVFFSNYSSTKAKQLAEHNSAAINFYWPRLERQVRMRGKVEKLDRQKSEAYFSTRPRDAQLGTHAWLQSSTLENREDLENRIRVQAEKFSDKPIPCPENWGGYVFTPFEYEFFQRRAWRLHDRLFYIRDGEKWKMRRLAP